MTTATAPFPIIDGKYTMEAEPRVQIGVILEEDAHETVEIETPLKAVLSANGQRVEVAAGSHISIQKKSLSLQVVVDNATVLENAEIIRLEAVTEWESPKAGDGFLVKQMLAGRGFHWAKRIDQTLTGALEFHPRSGGIIGVNDILLEEYMIGVVTSEMSGDCPVEFLKAQAVAARSWLLAQTIDKHPNEPFIWCNDDHCQRYQGTEGWSENAIQAINECRGEVLITEKNEYCDARYSKNTGGVSEDASSVWPDEVIDGLEAIIDAPKGDPVENFFPVTEENFAEFIEGDWLHRTQAFGSENSVSRQEVMRYLGRVDDPDSYFRWEKSFSHDELVESLQVRAGIKDVAQVRELRQGSRGRSGRLERLTVVYTTAEGTEKEHDLITEYKIREGLMTRFLYSSAFLIEESRSGDGKLQSVTLKGAGWGHGAGLCQMGGLARAIHRQDHRTIVHAYFSNVRLESIYS